MLPKEAYVIPSLLHEYHDNPMGGHLGDVETYLRVAQEWFWTGMRKEIVEYVGVRFAKGINYLNKIQLQPLLIPTELVG